MAAASESDKPLVWLHGEVKTRPPAIGPRCHELRIQDHDSTWRIIYRVDFDAVIITEVFAKKTPATPPQVIAVCKQRLRKYDKAAEDQDS